MPRVMARSPGRGRSGEQCVRNCSRGATGDGEEPWPRLGGRQLGPRWVALPLRAEGGLAHGKRVLVGQWIRRTRGALTRAELYATERDTPAKTREGDLTATASALGRCRP